MKKKLIILIAAMAVGAASASAFDASIYAPQSKFASGKWVKIRTSAEGIYQLTYPELEAMGFSDPSKVQVYGYGAVALSTFNNAFDPSFPDDVQPVATRHDGQRILFFGQGDAAFRASATEDYSNLNDNFYTRVRNHYDTASYYFLSDAFGTSDIPAAASATASATATPLNGHIHIDYLETDEHNPTNGGTGFFGRKFNAGDVIPYQFEINDFQPIDGADKCSDGSFFYRFAINSSLSITLPITLPEGFTKSYSNETGKKTSTSSISYQFSKGVMNFYGTDGSIADGTYTFTLKVPNSAMSYCAEDFVMLRYPRANRLDAQSPFLVMNIPANKQGQKLVFENAAEGALEIWNLDGFAPAAFSVAFDKAEGSASVVLTGKNKLAVAFNPAGTFASPEIVGEIENQNIHGRTTPEMVIITLESQLQEALQLAALHEKYQGMDVMVVVHDKVYNEFSSGSRDVMAYRRMAKMFYDRDPLKFKHLLFMGPAHYDNRGVEGADADRLVCWEQDDPSCINSIVLNYANDLYFGMLSDDYNHSKIHFERALINVGRIPSINAGQAAVYIDKVRERLENPMPAEVYNHVIVMAGDGDNAEHSRQACEVTETMRKIAPGMAFSPIHAEAYDKSHQGEYTNAVETGLTRGAGMMTYIGHGGPTSVHGWGISNVNNTKYEHQPFLMFSSCDQYSFDHLSNGIVETMLFTRGGGAIAGVGACRAVYVDQNQKTCVPVSAEYARAKAGDTYGDIFRRSRDLILDVYENDAKLYPEAFTKYLETFRNLLSYNFGGDPALPVATPLHQAQLASINSQSASGTATINPLTTNVFKGTVTKFGKVDSDFNGSVRIEVYEGDHTAKTNNYNNEQIYTPNTVHYDNEILAVGLGKVENGQFSVNITLPAPMFPSQNHRVVIAATSDDKAVGFGYYNQLAINDYNADSMDGTEFGSPVIEQLYADNADFQPGDEVTSSFTVYAVIDPSESGLSSATGTVATRTSLTIDGTASISNLESFLSLGEDGRYNLAAPVKDLADGSHTVELTIANNAGMVARGLIEVVVARRSLTPELTIEETPATSVATINLEGVNSADHTRLLVTDAAGNTVFSKANPVFPYEWNLKDNSDNDVNDGLYNVTVLVQSGRDYGSTPRTSLVVVR